MVRIRVFFLLWVLLISAGASAQDVDRFMVFFRDKADNGFSVKKPEKFLTDRAIERRARQSIGITEEDLPVSGHYLDSLRNLGFNPIFTSRWMNAVLLEADPKDMIGLLHKSFVKDYEYVAPDSKLSLQPSAAREIGELQAPKVVKLTSHKQLEMLGAEKMHEEGYTGSSVLIAVLDGGFNEVNNSSVFGHLYANNRVLDTRDFITNSYDVYRHDDHGSSALSCIAAKYEDSMVGTAYDASFAFYVTEDVVTENRIEEYNWLIAAERADSIGADIISSSLGYSLFSDLSMNYKFDRDANGKTSVVSRAAQWASDRGILVVNSAGNEGTSRDWPHIVFPADVEDVLTVGAVDTHGDYVGFSSKGPTADGRIKPDIAALGRSVAIFNEDNEVAPLNGTSFSAPLIAGLAASLWQKYPQLTNRELKELIIRSGSKYQEPDSLVGYGVPNYERAAAEVLSVKEILNGEITVFPNPFTDKQVSIRIDEPLPHETLKISIVSPDGSEVGRKTIKKHRKGHVYQIHIDSDTKGVYFLSVSSGDLVKIIKLLRY